MQWRDKSQRSWTFYPRSAESYDRGGVSDWKGFVWLKRLNQLIWSRWFSHFHRSSKKFWKFVKQICWQIPCWHLFLPPLMFIGHKPTFSPAGTEPASPATPPRGLAWVTRRGTSCQTGNILPSIGTGKHSQEISVFSIHQSFQKPCHLAIQFYSFFPMQVSEAMGAGVEWLRRSDLHFLRFPLGRSWIPTGQSARSKNNWGAKKLVSFLIFTQPCSV